MNKLSKVKATALYRLKENTVAIDFLPNKLMSFIYGFNGIGKTTVFKFLNAVLNPRKENLQILGSIKFDQIEIESANKDILTVKKANRIKSEWDTSSSTNTMMKMIYVINFLYLIRLKKVRIG